MKPELKVALRGLVMQYITAAAKPGSELPESFCVVMPEPYEVTIWEILEMLETEEVEGAAR